MNQIKLRLMKKFTTFDLWLEHWDNGDGYPCNIEVYRNKHGSMVCARHRGKRPGLVRFIAKMGISPIKANSRHSACSIGRAENGKWYGWSHRAIVGFGKGDRIFEENYGNEETLFVKHGRKTIATDDDARLAASRFAKSVS